MAAQAATFRENKPFLLCCEQSTTFCTPLNKVQNVYASNRASNNIEYSAENLAKLFNDGNRIDVSAYNNFLPNACHQEVELIFKPNINKENEINTGSNNNITDNSEFSLIMANYNNDKYIAEAINSVLNQTFKDWELIIVDDCSTDNSLSVIESFLSDKRIKLIKHEQNKGYISALKTGIANISSEYFGSSI